MAGWFCKLGRLSRQPPGLSVDVEGAVDAVQVAIHIPCGHLRALQRQYEVAEQRVDGAHIAERIHCAHQKISIQIHDVSKMRQDECCPAGVMTESSAVGGTFLFAQICSSKPAADKPQSNQMDSAQQVSSQGGQHMGALLSLRRSATMRQQLMSLEAIR